MLLIRLKMEHTARNRRGETFALDVTAMVEAEILPGWSWERYQKAKKLLLYTGLLKCVSEFKNTKGGRMQLTSRSFDTAERRKKPNLSFPPNVTHCAPLPPSRSLRAKKALLSKRKRGNRMTDSERIDDKSIKLAVLQATGGDVNKKLIEPSELTKVRRAIIDLTQTGLTPKEALANSLKGQ